MKAFPKAASRTWISKSRCNYTCYGLRASGFAFSYAEIKSAAKIFRRSPKAPFLKT